MYNFCTITASDKCFKRERDDESGLQIRSFLVSKGIEEKKYIVLPDDLEILKNEMVYMCDALKTDMILTTGGTGFSPRDITPEATKLVIEREIPGIPEAIRAYSLSITKRAMLSRAVCGIRGNTFILNLPGSPKAVHETLDYIFDSLMHGLAVLKENMSECART